MLENRAGIVLSLIFHAFLFIILYSTSGMNVSPPSARKITIRLNPAPSVPEPQVVMPPPQDVVATHKNAPVNDQPSTVKPPAPEPTKAPVSKPSPDKDYSHAVRKIQERLDQEERQIAGSMIDIRAEIEKRASDLKGVEADFESEGTDQGTIRIFDTGDVSKSQASRVLNTYGIRITRKFISGEGSLRYLNQAKLQDKTFFSKEGAGYYEVFEIPPRALKKLTSLERDEMIRRGLDPDSTRVVKIVFGIVKNDNEYDLGVKEFEYEEVD